MHAEGHVVIIGLYFQMLAAAHGVFSKSRQYRGGSRNSALVDQLLIVLSDGRGVDESAVSQR